MYLGGIIFWGLVFGIPVLLLIWFITSLILYIRRDKATQTGGAFIVMMWVSGVLFIFVVLFYAFVVWLITAFMASM